MIAIREKTLGPDHPNLTPTFVNLARLDRNEDQLEPAKDRLERALAIGDEKLPPDHRHVRLTIAQLVKVSRALGDTKRAGELVARLH